MSFVFAFGWMFDVARGAVEGGAGGEEGRARGRAGGQQGPTGGLEGPAPELGQFFREGPHVFLNKRGTRFAFSAKGDSFRVLLGLTAHVRPRPRRRRPRRRSPPRCLRARTSRPRCTSRRSHKPRWGPGGHRKPSQAIISSHHIESVSV